LRNRKPLLIVLSLLVLSGVMLTLIQAPIDWSLLAWGALAPFTLACTPSLRPRTLAWMALGVGYLYWLGNVYWIVPITKIGWLGMGFYLSLFWLLPALAVRFCRAKGLPLFIALPILVAGWERLQGFPMGGFYWRFLGHSQYQNLAMIQIADIFGAAGVSFVVAMVNGLIVDLILFAGGSRWVGCAQPIPAVPSPNNGQNPPHGLAPADLFAGESYICPLATPRRPSGRLIGSAIVATLLVVAGTALYGQWRLGQTKDYVTEGPRVASLQSNVPISVKRSFKASADIFDELMKKSQAAASAGVDLIVWPETMVQGLLDPALWPYLDGDLDQDKAFHKALGEHAKDKGYVLVGAYGSEIMTDPYGKRYLGNFNSAYFYHPDGTRDPGRYDKIHLVLFGEYIPFKKWFPWLFEELKVFLPKGWNPNYSLEHGTRYTTFEMATPVGGQNTEAGGQPSGPPSDRRPPYRFGVIICYEDTIPYVGRNFTLDPQGRKRVDWLVNISNDGWFVRFKNEPERVLPSTELPQHAAICAFRAVENRLAIVRSVNTGISCLIESTGRIRDGYLAASDDFPQRAMDRTALAGWFLDRLPIDKRVTFYSRHGEWFADSCEIVFAAALAWPLGARLVRRRAKTGRAS
jgi:apolipoprotein N-acyltransferase